MSCKRLLPAGNTCDFNTNQGSQVRCCLINGHAPRTHQASSTLLAIYASRQRSPTNKNALQAIAGRFKFGVADGAPLANFDSKPDAASKRLLHSHVWQLVYQKLGVKSFPFRRPNWPFNYFAPPNSRTKQAIDAAQNSEASHADKPGPHPSYNGFSLLHPGTTYFCRGSQQWAPA